MSAGRGPRRWGGGTAWAWRAVVGVAAAGAGVVALPAVAAAAAPYSATIAASATSVAAGQSVTLTATANQNVWPTPYGLSIFDVTTSTVVAHTGGSSTSNADTVLQATVTEPSATTQQYVARIDSRGGAPIAYTSAPISVTWTGTAPPPPAAPTVTSVDPSSGASGGGTTITVDGTNLTGATAVHVGTGTATSVTVNSAGTALTAVTPAGSGTVDVTVTTPGGTSAATTADQFTYGYVATIAASATSVAAGQSVTLTATANQNVWPTPYGLSIFDVTTSTVVAHTGGSSTGNADTVLQATVTESSSTTQQYVARIDNTSGAVAYTSAPVAVTWTGTAPPPPPPPLTLSEAGTFPVNDESPGLSTLSVDPQHVGDLIVVSAQEHWTGFGVLSITGGNAGPWARAARFVDVANNLTYEVWYAPVTATGPAALQLSYSAGSTEYPIELVGDSYTASSPAAWSVVASGGSSNGSSGTVVWPALASGSTGTQLYWGSSEEASAGYAGSTSGFTYHDTWNYNTFLDDPALPPATVVQPSSVESPPDPSTSVAAIFAAVAQ